MQNSAFRNPHGLPARGHYTTAHDLAMLAKAIIGEFPDFYSLYAEREFSYNGIAQHNRNALLWRDPSVDGMKTGYTDAAGYCLVTSAERDGMRLIAVVLGAPSAAPAQRRRAEAARVRLHELRDAQAVFRGPRDRQRARLGRRARVRGLGSDRGRLRDDSARRVREARGQHGRHGASSRRRSLRGTTVGEVKVSFDGEQLVTSPLVVLTNVMDGGVWARMRDELQIALGMSGADESLLKFPTDLAVKVFGRNDPEFRDAVLDDRRGALRQGLHASPSRRASRRAI